MPRRRGNGPEHARARCRAQEETVRSLVAGPVMEAHAAHTAALHDPVGWARTFLGEAALPNVRALNRAGALALLLAMPRVVSAVWPGLIGPQAAFYGYWMEWRTSNWSRRPLSMGDTLRLTGEGSATSLHSSTPALLHALRTRHPKDAAPYLSQARATYPGEVSELDAELHLLHPPEEDLGVGEVRIFVEGPGETPTRPRPTKPSIRRHEADPPMLLCASRSPESPPGVVPSCWPLTRPAAGPTNDLPPPYPGRGVPAKEGRSSGKSARVPPCSSSSSSPAGTRNGSWRSPPPTSTGQRRCPAPPSRRPRRGTGCTPSWGHRRSSPLRGSTLCDSPRHHLTTLGGPGR